ncbi:MAG: hypothetical protein CM1200mP23_4920 [Nitrososphaerota archaeon]|nr:MAG: hypothetical protein CM1200mP23_4920 [Nitrososphaerota archaeon]
MRNLQKNLVLKDGKCPVCDSSVDHLKPLFQKKHIENEIEGIKKKVTELENDKDELEQNTVKLSRELEKAKRAETILSTHKIKNELQLEKNYCRNQDESKANAKNTTHS